MTIDDVAEFLQGHDNYLILQHKRPDGDALGSSAALCLGLRTVGKKAFLLRNPDTTTKFEKYVENLYMPEGYYPHTIVTVDTAAEDMFQLGADDYNGDVDLALDHHPSNTEYAAVSYIRPEKAACGEVIFEILKRMQCPISKQIADDLYFAISTDTGCFCYGNTTAETLEAAAELVRLGADNKSLNKVMHRTKSKKRIAIEGLILSGIEFFREGTVAIATVTQSMLEQCGATDNDMDDIASIPGQIEGVIVGVTIKEQKNGNCKISVRTTDAADANDICSEFGGGGHKMAAGCNIECDYTTAKELILKSIDRSNGKYNTNIIM